MPEDLKHFSKTKPISDEHMEIVKLWWDNRVEIFEEGNEKSRCFKKLEIAANGYNLDLCKYPKEEEEILSIKDTIINYKKHSEAAEEKINSTLAKITEILGIEL
jgi:type I restriction enzyme M protein